MLYSFPAVHWVHIRTKQSGGISLLRHITAQDGEDPELWIKGNDAGNGLSNWLQSAEKRVDKTQGL
ncbi:hypothetical protein MASR2M79_21990 [Aminivibrio sp.]